MEKPENSTAYKRLVRDITTSFRAYYTPADMPALWRGLDDYQYRISGTLRKRAYAMAGRAGAKEPGQVRRFLDRLADAALKVLERDGSCESRIKAGKKKYRVTRGLSAARAAANREANDGASGDVPDSAEPTAGAQEAPPADGAAPAPPQAAPGGAAGTIGAQTITHLPVTGLKPHPRAHLIPKMPPKQWQPFLAHVAKHGVREPVLVTPDGIIIDGRSRSEAARESGYQTVPALVVDWDEDRQETYMLEAAVRRRHMKDDQLAMVEERLRKRDEARMRQERARKAGRAGGRGRPKKTDSLPDTVSGELSSPSANGDGATEQAPAAQPRPAVPERKRRAARAVDRASSEMGDRVLAGEVSLGEATRELRGQGQLPPAKAPRLDDITETSTPPRAAEAANRWPGVGLPLDSGVALAEALVTALGVDVALALLREAVAAVEVHRTQPVTGGSIGSSGVLPEGADSERAASGGEEAVAVTPEEGLAVADGQ